MTTSSSTRVKPGRASGRVWGMVGDLSGIGRWGADSPDGQDDGPDVVVFEVQQDRRLERLRLIDREVALVAERLAGLNPNLIGVLRPEAAVGASAFGKAEDAPGHVGAIGNVERKSGLADGLAPEVSLSIRDDERGQVRSRVEERVEADSGQPDSREEESPGEESRHQRSPSYTRQGRAASSQVAEPECNERTERCGTS